MQRFKLFTFLKADRTLPRYRLRLLLVIAHSFFLLGLTILLQYSAFVRSDELGFLKWGAIYKHLLFHWNPKPDKDRIVFIDVSKDLALAADTTYGASAPNLNGAVSIITDRSKLAVLFDTLSRHAGQYRYAICDILFDQPDTADRALRGPIEKTSNLLCSATFDKGAHRPIFKVPSAMVNYQAIDGSKFAKLDIYYRDSLKTFPVYLYEKLTANHFRKQHGVVLLNGHPTFNTVIPEFYYRAEDLHYNAAGGNKVNTYYLGRLLLLPDFFEALRGKLIVIGDFSARDTHTTYAGSMPGPLILLDTYLTLAHQPVIISVGWCLLLLAFYTGVSYWLIFHPDRKIKELHDQLSSRIKVPLISKFIIKYLSFIGLLILINMVSYFYFGTFISLFYIATYLTFIQLLIDKWPQWTTWLKRK